MTQQQDVVHEAVQQSGLKLGAMSETQQTQVLAAVANALPRQQSGPPGTLETFSLNLGCIACEAGLNAVGGVAIAAMIAAGVAVGPEAAAVVTIAGFFGVDASAVAAAINAALAGGTAGGVETVISNLCSQFGAC